MSKFVWYDLMTPDVAASAKFYGHVVGWQIADSGMPGMNYSVIKAGGIDVGGMMPVPPSAPGGRPLWNGYIYSSDVDADARKAVKLGGAIHQAAMDIPGVGRFAVVADPSGATFLLFKDRGGPKPATVARGEPGHVAWRDLNSGDWQAAWKFYTGMFGWTKSTAIDMGPMGTYQIFAVNGADVGGMMTKSPTDPSPPHWNYYFGVDAMAAAVARAVSMGANFAREAMEVPGGGYAISGMDPQGALFSLYSLKA